MPEKQDSVAVQVIQALEESQRSFAGHRKCIIRLKQAQAIDAVAFRNTLNASIDRALLIFRREPSIERMLTLVASFAAFSNDKYQADSELGVEMLQRLMPLTYARDKAVRFRACQLTTKLLNSLGEDAEVSEVAKVAEVAEVAQSTETAEVAQITETAETAEVAEVPQVE